MKNQRGFAGLVTLIIYGVLAAGALAAIYGVYHGISEHFAEQGRAEVRLKLAPLTDQCDRVKGSPTECALAWQRSIDDARTLAGNYARCQQAAAEQSAAIEAASAASVSAKAATAKILAEIAKRSVATQSTIRALTQAAATPAATKEKACEAADSILRDLSDRRMRYYGVTPATGRNPNDNGAGALPGTVHIRP